MTENISVLRARIDSSVNYAKRILSAAGYLTNKPKKQFTKVSNSETIKKIHAWMENYNKNFIEPFEQLLNSKNTSEWTALANLSSPKSFPEVKKLFELKQAMRREWNNRPEFMKNPDAKKRTFKKTTNEKTN